MPIQYNYDKAENPISKGFQSLPPHIFILFRMKKRRITKPINRGCYINDKRNIGHFVKTECPFCS